jgi:hypothetical protein
MNSKSLLLSAGQRESCLLGQQLGKIKIAQLSDFLDSSREFSTKTGCLSWRAVVHALHTFFRENPTFFNVEESLVH